MARNIDVSARNGELRLTAGGETLLLHTPECPAVFAGRGKESIKMYRGNFDVNDRVSERFALRLSSADGETLTFTHRWRAAAPVRRVRRRKHKPHMAASVRRGGRACHRRRRAVFGA